MIVTRVDQPSPPPRNPDSFSRPELEENNQMRKVDREPPLETRRLGDAVVIRNAGGRITPAVIRDLGILGVLAVAANQQGTSPIQPELVVIHHTDCGMSRLANPAIQGQVSKRLGLSVDEVSAMAISDPTTSVQDDIDRLRHTPGTPDQLIVSGFVYDVSSGTINQVVPPAPLRAS